jgi:hypothetical protein
MVMKSTINIRFCGHLRNVKINLKGLIKFTLLAKANGTNMKWNVAVQRIVGSIGTVVPTQLL